MMRYWIYRTYIRLVSQYSLPSPFLSALTTIAVLAISTTFFLIAITGIKVSKTNTSFLTLFWVLRTFVRVMTFLFIVEMFDVGDILLFILNDVGTYCKKVIAAILSLPATALRNSLVILGFFIGLALVSEILLGMLLIRYINKRSISRLILSRVFFHFSCRPIPLETLSINLVSISRWL